MGKNDRVDRTRVVGLSGKHSTNVCMPVCTARQNKTRVLSAYTPFRCLQTTKTKVKLRISVVISLLEYSR